LEFLARAIRQLEEIEWIQTGKEKAKSSLLADYTFLYLKDPKNSAKKLLDIINTFSKVAEINIQKSVAFLYTNNEQTETEFRKTIPFTMVS
jgi:hypothetical protein